jgi:hypothetical protein
VATTLAEVLRHFEVDYVHTHALSTAQARACRAIVACRTPVLGGQRWRCDGCEGEQWRWHSCIMGSVPIRGARGGAGVIFAYESLVR